MPSLIKRTSLVLLLYVLIIPSTVFSQVLSITSGRAEPFVKPDHSGFYDLIVKQMFERVGLQAKTVVLPSERSLVNADKGVDDGNIARIKGIEKKYKNLLMVPEKVIDFDFIVFSKNKYLNISDWRSLQPWNVAYINGWKVFEKNVRFYKSLVHARDSKQLFKLLKSDRVDLVLYDYWSGQWELQNQKGIYSLHPPLASYELYLYINKRHKHLLDKLATALRDMKQDGSYQKIYRQSLLSLKNNEKNE